MWRRSVVALGVVLLGYSLAVRAGESAPRSGQEPEQAANQASEAREPGPDGGASPEGAPGLPDRFSLVPSPDRALLFELESELETIDAQMAGAEFLKLRREQLLGEIEELRRREQERRAKVDAVIPEAIEPLPPFEIPDDPPPHEGALINFPTPVEPPDLLVIEVLEALPGRPITGERLVRPDGTVSLDFYGKLHVAGLTIDQIKAKVVVHLRDYLTDEALGLLKRDPETGEEVAVPPAETDRVFVDITAYNHLVYYVQGDVGAPGRLPCTGTETVLDALNYAGFLAPTADREDVRLVRPARGNAPTRAYKIDLDSILDEGDPTANLQLFPGDRLIVGRHDTVEGTIAVDRLTASVNTVVQTILNLSYAVQSASNVLRNPKLTPGQRQALVDTWVEIAWPIMTEGEAAELDRDRLRAILRRGFLPEEAVSNEAETENPSSA